ncbi:MAG: right-handed parallel beta-helix repeat-containing protein [Planctomycetota bacterium]
MRHRTDGICVLTLSIIAFSLTSCVPEREQKADKVAEVKASSFGFDPADSTKALQAAIDSGASRVIVEDMGSPWIVTPIKLASDQEIVFQKGVVVEAKKGEFKGRADALFSIIRKENVTLTGDGAVLRMHRWDYDKPPYERAEWRHVVNIKSSSNVKIYGLTLAESGGDGIYLGCAERGVTNKGIHIKDVVCDGNYRQGISVITAEDMLIENTIMKNTGGTPPEAGIDFEPNHSSERIVNCVMRNCVSEDNKGCGYVFYLPNLTGESAPVSLRMENCVARGTNRVPFSFYTGNEDPAGAVKGLAEFVNCTFADGVGPSITVSRKPASACRLRFVNCRLVNPAKDKPEEPAILFETRVGNTQDVGGVEFDKCALEDPVNHPIMKFTDREGCLRLLDVTGSLTVRRDGVETVHTFTKEWLDGIRVGKLFKRFPKYEAKGVRFEPIAADLSPDDLKLQPFNLRKSGTFVIYARQGEEVAFALRYLQVGKYGGGPMPVAVATPSGKKISLGNVPFKEEASFRFSAAETGLYRLPIDCDANKVQMVSANRPVCISGEEGSIRFISSTGDLYFYVPTGAKEFGIKVFGEGDGEGVGATIFDPDGRKLWEKPTITMPEQFVCTPEPSQTGKAWRITIAKPVGTTMEDFYVDVQGVPPFLAFTPKAALKPVGP